MASELIKAMLLRQMSNAGRPMYSPWEALGTVALTAALANRQNKEDKQEKVDSANLAGVLAQNSTPKMQIPLVSIGDQGPQAPLSANAQPVTSTPQYNALKQLPPQALQQVLASQMFQPPQQDQYADSTLGIYNQRTGELKTPAAPKPETLQAYNVQLPNGETTIGMESGGGIYRIGKDGKADKNNPITEGRIVGLAVNAPTIDDLNPAPLSGDKTSERGLSATRINTNNLLQLTGRLREQLAQDPNTGLVGMVVQGTQALKEQVNQLKRLGAKDVALASDIAGYGDVFDQFTWLDESARNSAAVKANIVRLAYVQAKALDPSGRIAKDDVKAAMETMAASGGSPTQMLAALDEMDAFARMNAQNTYEDIRGNPPPPDWLFGGKPKEPQKTTLPDGTTIEILQ